MTKKTLSCASVLLAFLAALACLGVLLAGWAWLTLPTKIALRYGPPNPELGQFQRFYLTLRLLQQADALDHPAKPAAQEQTFVVDFGESTYSITSRLQEDGLITDAGALRDYLVYRGLDTSLQAGEFLLKPGMNAVEIAGAMQDATPTHVKFSLLPGWRLEEIAASLPTSGLAFTADQFLAAANTIPLGSAFGGEIPPGASLEGFLFPDRYRLARDLTVDQFILTLLQNFEAHITPEILQGFDRQGLSLRQAVIVASIVQREAVVEEEMPLIASVYLNRLAAGMKLDADPTVQYALGYDPVSQAWWKSPLSLEDLQISSPYNTYQIPALPPGPIANPGASALEAVAYPAQTPYYYFRAACDGSGRHTFAKTFEEQVGNACP